MPTCCLRPKDPVLVHCVAGTADRDLLCSWGCLVRFRGDVDNKTEWSGAEVADIASYESRPVAMWKEGCHRGEYAKQRVALLRPKDPVLVHCVAGTADCDLLSSVAGAVWCGSGVIVDGKTEWSGAEVADIASYGSRPVGMEGGLSPR